MPETKKDRLLGILKTLTAIGDIEGSAIVTRDGLLIASDLPRDVDAETFAAMSATMLGAAETAVSELKRGIVERVIAEGKQSKLIAKGAGASAVLVSMVRPDANLGLVLVEIGKASEKIEKEMSA
ncbi:MAG: roadblock/LC7 domain-containing protein [Candidatus Altiarchaeota archaeon]